MPLGPELEQALLAEEVYRDYPPGGRSTCKVDNWRDISDDVIALRAYGLHPRDLCADKKSGFRARLYVPKRGLPAEGMPAQLVFRGTEATSVKDWGANLCQARGVPSEYYKRAAAIGKAMAVAPNRNIEVVGHSLGGGLASVASLTSGCAATLFSSAGVHEQTRQRLLDDGYVLFNGVDIMSYHVAGDALTSLQRNSCLPEAIGTAVSVPAPKNEFWNGVAAKLDRHRMASVIKALRQEQARMLATGKSSLRAKERLHAVPRFGYLDMPPNEVRTRLLNNCMSREDRARLHDRIWQEAHFAISFARQYRRGLSRNEMRFHKDLAPLVRHWDHVFPRGMPPKLANLRLDELRCNAKQVRHLLRDMPD